jgi:hypothetical protein
MPMHIPKILYGMNAAFNAGLEACVKLMDAAGLFGLISGKEEECLGDCFPPSFSNA